MSRSSSPGCFSGAGDEFDESEFEFPSKADRVRWTALGLDEFHGDSDGSGEGYAPRFLSRSGEGSAPRCDEFLESDSESERARTALGSDGAAFSLKSRSHIFTNKAKTSCSSPVPIFIESADSMSVGSPGAPG